MRAVTFESKSYILALPEVCIYKIFTTSELNIKKAGNGHFECMHGDLSFNLYDIDLMLNNNIATGIEE
jgi:hypothetical protein